MSAKNEGAIVVGNYLGAFHAVLAGTRYVAYFAHADHAREWARTNYPERHIIDACDLASVAQDNVPESK